MPSSFGELRGYQFAALGADGVDPSTGREFYASGRATSIDLENFHDQGPQWDVIVGNASISHVQAA
jgi:hypothetical protein